ncbi:hypothetical protein AB0H79_11450, partial [Micrococcus luteus]
LLGVCCRHVDILPAGTSCPHRSGVNRTFSSPLYIVFAVCLWNALKFLLFGPISLLLLGKARVHEYRARRDLQRSSTDAVAA